MKIKINCFLFCLLNIISFSCQNLKPDSEGDFEEYEFVLIDSTQISIPYDFKMVFDQPKEGKLLAYSYADEMFHVLDSQLNVLHSFNRMGDGPEQYNNNLMYATILDDKVVIMDNRKISFYSFKGDWVKNENYQKLNDLKAGGPPNDYLLFINQNKFIIPNLELSKLSFIPDHSSILDTLPVWYVYEYSKDSKSFQIKEKGFLDSLSNLRSDQKFNDYSPRIFLENGTVNLYNPNFPILYQYQINGEYPSKTWDLKLPNFKKPQGLNYPAISFENFMEFNRMSDINSYFNSLIILEDQKIFCVFHSGKNVKMEDPEEDFEQAKSKIQATIYHRSKSLGKTINLPKINGEIPLLDKMVYLGKNKFLFVHDNEVERDYYIGRIYVLKKNEK